MKPPMDDAAFLAVATPLIASDEGCRLTAYKDTVGVWTIGYGHAHVTPGLCWTQDEATAALHSDLGRAIGQIDHALPWWRTLNDARRYVLLNMAFNMGIGGLLGFGHTLQAIREGNFTSASGMMLLSKWSQQVPHRAARLANIMKTGEIPQ